MCMTGNWIQNIQKKSYGQRSLPTYTTNKIAYGIKSSGYIKEIFYD